MNNNSSNSKQITASARPVSQIFEDVEVIKQEIKQLYTQDELPWIVGYSGGKDSTAVLQLIWYAVSELPPKDRGKPIHVITTDTMVENPMVSIWVRNSLDRMKSAGEEQGVLIDPVLCKPAIQDTFWVNLIGKGYPAPRLGFRWCTERLKIRPSDNYVRDMIRASGEVILVLGTRIAESSSRSLRMEKHRTAWRLTANINYNPSRPNSLIYTPIEDWQSGDVWIYLLQVANPWGISNHELFKMYRGATPENDCPLVIDTSTPSCGNSRFGCWVCTLVEHDKSMEAMIQNDEEKAWMQPLLNLRDELDVEDDLDRRDFRRRQGHIQLYERNKEGSSLQKEVVNIPGPYTKEWRARWLQKVLLAQAEARKHAPLHLQNIELITQEELSEIRRIWLEEFHEFDDTLPHIYREVTGDIFQDPRPNAGNSQLSSFEWDLLKDICEDDMELELLARLLDTERQYQTMSRRSGIINALEKIFDTSSRDRDFAMQNAHDDRTVKQTLEAIRQDTSTGDIEALKQALDDLRQSLDDTDLPSELLYSEPTPKPKPSAPPRAKATEPSATYDTDNWAAAKFKQTP